MATFRKIWTVESHQFHDDGDTIAVSLKSGKVKMVTLGHFIEHKTSKDGSSKYYYTSEKADSAGAEV